MKEYLDENYRQALVELLEYELENGAKLKEGLSVDSAIDAFMESEYATVFGLGNYLEEA